MIVSIISSILIIVLLIVGIIRIGIGCSFFRFFFIGFLSSLLKKFTLLAEIFFGSLLLFLAKLLLPLLSFLLATFSAR
jgi:hypothetical protein